MRVDDPAAQSEVRGDGAAGAVGDVLAYCPFCMYDLRGLSGASCPECGGALDREQAGRSSLPWLHRAGGLWARLRAFFGTCVFVTFRQKRFYAEMVRPVDLKAALRFRSQVVLFSFFALVLPFFAAYLFDAGLVRKDLYDWVDALEGLRRDNAAMWVGLLSYGALALWLYLVGLTGLHTYWFHPKSMPVAMQDRALALSYYAWAPLAWLVVPSLLGVGVVLLMALAESFGALRKEIQTVGWIVVLAAFVLIAVVFAMVVSNLVRLAHRLARRTWVGTLGMLGVTWFGAIGLGAVLFVGLPLLMRFVYLMVATL